MNFLEICKQVRQEAGIAGDGPASVTGQTGQYKKVVDWVKRAYASIQTARPDWDFLWFEDSFVLPANQTSYALKDIDLRMKSVVRDSGFIQSLDGQKLPLEYSGYEEFKRMFMTSNSVGLPRYFTTTPDRVLRFNSAPDFDATVYLEGMRSPHVMVNNTDEPVFSVEFHDIIVYRALMYYSANEEAGNIYQDARANFDEMFKRMELEYVPAEFDLPEPLA